MKTFSSSQTGITMPVVIAVVVLAMGGIGFWYVTSQSSDSEMVETSLVQPQTQPSSASPNGASNNTAGEARKTGEANTTAGEAQTISGYQVYSSQLFEQAKEQRRVLFFHASWCPTCKVANQEFTDNAANIPSDVVIFKTDYDSSAELKKKYGVTYQHTFVYVDEMGNEITKWNGGDLDQVLNNI